MYGRRTAAYVECIAKELKRQGRYSNILTDRYLSDMVVAAPLHDLGKIHIPDAVLNKPGKLTEEEFEIMKTHTTAGEESGTHFDPAVVEALSSVPSRQKKCEHEI